MIGISTGSTINIKFNIILTEKFSKFKIHKTQKDSLLSEFSFVNDKFISKEKNNKTIEESKVKEP